MIDRQANVLTQGKRQGGCSHASQREVRGQAQVVVEGKAETGRIEYRVPAQCVSERDKALGWSELAADTL